MEKVIDIIMISMVIISSGVLLYLSYRMHRAYQEDQNQFWENMPKIVAKYKI